MAAKKTAKTTSTKAQKKTPRVGGRPKGKAGRKARASKGGEARGE